LFTHIAFFIDQRDFRARWTIELDVAAGSNHNCKDLTNLFPAACIMHRARTQMQKRLPLAIPVSSEQILLPTVVCGYATVRVCTG
jgi:hypothetical protein